MFDCEDVDSPHAACVTKMDEQFRARLEPVFAALAQNEQPELRVLYDDSDPKECRVALSYYTQKHASAVATKPFSGETSLDEVKKITLTVPASDHAVLKAAWERSRGGHPGLTFEAFMRQVMGNVLSTVRLLSS